MVSKQHGPEDVHIGVRLRACIAQVRPCGAVQKVVRAKVKFQVVDCRVVSLTRLVGSKHKLHHLLGVPVAIKSIQGWCPLLRRIVIIVVRCSTEIDAVTRLIPAPFTVGDGGSVAEVALLLSVETQSVVVIIVLPEAHPSIVIIAMG